MGESNDASDTSVYDPKKQKELESPSDPTFIFVSKAVLSASYTQPVVNLNMSTNWLIV